jgi:hypothetical protein
MNDTYQSQTCMMLVCVEKDSSRGGENQDTYGIGDQARSLLTSARLSVLLFVIYSSYLSVSICRKIRDEITPIISKVQYLANGDGFINYNNRMKKGKILHRGFIEFLL